MNSLYSCIDEPLKKLTQMKTEIENQERLLARIKEYTEKGFDLWRPVSIDDLIDLLYIHPRKKDAFLTKMSCWSQYRLLSDNVYYYSLVDLLKTYSFLSIITPFTLYAMPSAEKGNIR